MMSNQDDSADKQLARAKEDYANASGLIRRYQENRTAFLDETVGDPIHEALKNPQIVAEWQRHSDPVLRIAGLLLGRDYWKPDDAYCTACTQLAFQDPHSEVRGIALYCLLRCHQLLDEPTLTLVARVIKESILPGDKSEVMITSGSNQQVDLVSKYKKMRLQLWKSWLGPLAEEMIGNPTVARTYLSSSSPELRRAALSILKECGISIEQECETMALTDTDPMVREFAVMLLGEIYAKTNTASIGKMLATMVRNESEPIGLRRLAYSALFKLRGIPILSQLAILRPPNRFAFPEDVDWSFVNSFLQ